MWQTANLNPTPAGPCVDKLDNCALYGSSACTGQYLPWAQDNCQKYCDLCRKSCTQSLATLVFKAISFFLALSHILSESSQILNT